MTTQHHPRESGEAISDEQMRVALLAGGLVCGAHNTRLIADAVRALTPPAAPSGDFYRQEYLRITGLLGPAWDYIQAHQDEFGIKLGEDKTPYVIKAFLDSRAKPAPSVTAEAVASPADLQGLKEKLLSPCSVTRDEDGMMYHPDLPDCDEDVRYDTLLSAFGIEAAFVGLENDAPEEVSERYFESGEADCSYWTPTPPVGDGWLLAAVYVTDNGPYAMFIREKRPEPKQSRRALAQRAGTGGDAKRHGCDALVDAARFAADVLSELYVKYQRRIGPFASQAQLANVRLGIAIRDLDRNAAQSSADAAMGGETS